jgi:hypothetical protein
VYFTAYVAGLVLVAAYSAALVSFLTVQRSELPFTSFQGLLEDGTYKLGVTKGAEVSYFSVRSSVMITSTLSFSRSSLQTNPPLFLQGQSKSKGKVIPVLN